MCDAIRVYVRYDIKDEHGKTRRERNEAFDHDAPILRVPESGVHLWDWYFDLSQRLMRVRDSACIPIPPSEFVAWCRATKNIVYPHEYAILGKMDFAYVAEMNIELSAYSERQREEAKRNAGK